MPAIDSLIAVAALQYHLCLVTRNTSDFTNCNVKRCDLWQ